MNSDLGTNCKTILCLHSSYKYMKKYTSIGTYTSIASCLMSKKITGCSEEKKTLTD